MNSESGASHLSSGHIYENAFFHYVNTTSLRSAAYFLQNVRLPFAVQSVLDIGCGRGAWLLQWQKLHQVEILGMDGDYVSTDSLLIDPACFQAQDLRLPFTLGRQFDLVQCLEVAEHINQDYADTLVKNICEHGKTVLFSAAQPGQGGEHHVNEQTINYWVEKFSRYGYVCFDAVRPQISEIHAIEPWYRFNTVLFIQKSLLDNLPKEWSYLPVTADYDFMAAIPMWWRVRNHLLSYLPVSWLTRLSKVKQRLLPLLRLKSK